MGIDIETIPNIFNIVLNDSEPLFKVLRERANEDQDQKDTYLNLSLDDFNTIGPNEYYYDEKTNEIVISFDLDHKNGSITAYIRILLSDIVMIDIMQAMVKRLNKLKVAMEALK